MVIKFLNWLIEKKMSFSKKPWARFSTNGILEDNQVKFEMSYNKAFIKNIEQKGFTGTNEEETVHNFLFGTLMIPKSIMDEYEDVVNSEAHPQLSAEANVLKR